MIQHYPFELQPLPYLYDALEPKIDMETMYFHHDKHLRAYINNLNQALEPYPEYHSWSLERLLLHLQELPAELRDAVRKNGGGVYNHELYFESLTPTPMEPMGKLKEALLLDFRDLEAFKGAFFDMAMTLFGSGYLWLVSDHRGKLAIVPLPNQDTPLSKELYPLLNLDLWEHAYYLKHQNRKINYIHNWYSLVHWEEVNRRYQEALLSIALQNASA
ncbi:MAG: superoxide dismutase [Lachnospiraceae bacterium]|nr:superoxide dismutase [Lachnospiraceae bacterium]